MAGLFFAALANFAMMHAPQALLPEISREFRVSVDTVSWAIGATTIGAAVGVLLWARLSDRWGRIRTLKLSVLIGLCLGFVTPLVPTFELFIILRAAQGLALAGLVGIAVVALAETIRPHVLGIALGTYVAGNTVGGLAGRVFGGLVIDELGWRGSLLFVAAISAVATVLFFVLIPPTAVAPKPGLSVWRGLISNLSNWGVFSLVLLGFLNMGSFVAIFNYLAFRLEDPPFLLTLAQVSWLFLTYLAGTVSSDWVWGIASRIPVTYVMLGSLMFVVAGALLMLSNSLWLVIVGLTVYTASVFGLHSLFTGLITRRADGLPGESQAPSLYMLGFYAGMSVVGWFGGVVYQNGDWIALIIMVICIAAIAGLVIWGYAQRNGGLRHADR